MVGGMFFVLALSIFPVPSIYASCPSSITTNTKLAADCTGGIVIGADNIVLNCDGHTITGVGSIFDSENHGIFVLGRTGVTIKNCHVTNFGVAFEITSSSSNNFINNAANGNVIGFHLANSNGNVLKQNTANDNNACFPGGCGGGFSIGGFSSNNILQGNTANNNLGTLGVFLQANSGFTLSGFGANGNTLKENTANGNALDGFSLRFSASSNTLKENAACSNSVFDAFQDGSSTSNVFKENSFCTTSGI